MTMATFLSRLALRIFDAKRAECSDVANLNTSVPMSPLWETLCARKMRWHRKVPAHPIIRRLTLSRGGSGGTFD